MGYLGEVGEEEGSQWFEEEQVWENNRRRGEKELVLCKESLARMQSVLISD